MENHRRTNRSHVEVPAGMKPLRGRSNFAVSTARREIHGDLLHRTTLPPTLQGFLYGDDFLRRPQSQMYSNGLRDEGDDEEEEEEDDNRPHKNYGRFTRLPGTSDIPFDPSMSFLRDEFPRTSHVFLLDSCNGYLLFGHIRHRHFTPSPDYIVCNPATRQWVPVPRCDGIDDGIRVRVRVRYPRNFVTSRMHIYLLFDPAVSSHFHVVVFFRSHDMDENGVGLISAHSYSSETMVWNNSETDWSLEERLGLLEAWRRPSIIDGSIVSESPGAFVDGMLFLNLGKKRILQVDMEGRTQGTIPMPGVHADADNNVIFLGQSQGRLHCIIEEGHEEVIQRPVHVKQWKGDGLAIWILGDLDTQEWVFKHHVSFRHLFGTRRYCEGLVDYRVVAMHPDCDMVFFHQRWDAEMISYDFNSQEVRAVDTVEVYPTEKIIPYIPYLSELFDGVLGATIEL